MIRNNQAQHSMNADRQVSHFTVHARGFRQHSGTVQGREPHIDSQNPLSATGFDDHSPLILREYSSTNENVRVFNPKKLQKQKNLGDIISDELSFASTDEEHHRFTDNTLHISPAKLTKSAYLYSGVPKAKAKKGKSKGKGKGKAAEEEEEEEEEEGCKHSSGQENIDTMFFDVDIEHDRRSPWCVKLDIHKITQPPEGISFSLHPQTIRSIRIGGFYLADSSPPTTENNTKYTYTKSDIRFYVKQRPEQFLPIYSDEDIKTKSNSNEKQKYWKNNTTSQYIDLFIFVSRMLPHNYVEMDGIIRTATFHCSNITMRLIVDAYLTCFMESLEKSDLRAEEEEEDAAAAEEEEDAMTEESRQGWKPFHELGNYQGYIRDFLDRSREIVEAIEQYEKNNSQKNKKNILDKIPKISSDNIVSMLNKIDKYWKDRMFIDLYSHQSIQPPGTPNSIQMRPVNWPLQKFSEIRILQLRENKSFNDKNYS